MYKRLRGATGTFECEARGCNKKFEARIADRNRGWARCCSRACASMLRETNFAKAKAEAKEQQE